MKRLLSQWLFCLCVCAEAALAHASDLLYKDTSFANNFMKFSSFSPRYVICTHFHYYCFCYGDMRGYGCTQALNVHFLLHCNRIVWLHRPTRTLTMEQLFLWHFNRKSCKLLLNCLKIFTGVFTSKSLITKFDNLMNLT